MSKIYINVTELAEWQGKLTGIPRVMNELSLRFSEEGNAAFVIWDRRRKAFYLVNIDKILGKYRNMTAAGGVPSNDQVSVAILKSVKRQIKKVPWLREILIIPYNILRKTRRAFARLKKNPYALERYDHFQKGDIMLIPWGPWEDPCFIEKLKELKSNGIKLVQVVHDMLPIITPHLSGHSTDDLINYSREVYPICNLLIAVSEHTKKDVEQWLSNNKLNIPQIETIKSGDNFRISNSLKPIAYNFKKAKIQGQDFILCVGTIEARKNHALLYYVYKLAHQKGIKLPIMVVVGRRGWQTVEIYNLMKYDPEVKTSFVFLHEATDEELSWLYQNCLFSIYPSFYEGWGLPIAESLFYGTPVLASNTSSMPEIAGNLIEYFSPSSTDECLKAIQFMLQPDNQIMARKKARKYKPIDWDTTFKQVKEAIYARE